MDIVARNLRKVRMMKGVKQDDLVEELGLTVRTYSKYETGITSPDTATLLKICSILKVPVEIFFSEDVYSYKAATTSSRLSDTEPVYTKKQAVGRKVHIEL